MSGQVLKVGGAASAGGGGSALDVSTLPFLYPPFTPTGDDDEFDDGNFSGWTTVQGASPLVVPTESGSILSIKHPGGDASQQLHAFMKSRSIVAGDWIEICFSGSGFSQNFNIHGLLFANGTTYGAGIQVAFFFSASENIWSLWGFNNYNSGTWPNIQVTAVPANMATLQFLRFKYNGSNTWVGYMSNDGITWIQVLTWNAWNLTPTALGFFTTTWGGASAFNLSVHYVRFGNG